MPNSLNYCCWISNRYYWASEDDYWCFRCYYYCWSVQDDAAGDGADSDDGDVGAVAGDGESTGDGDDGCCYYSRWSSVTPFLLTATSGSLMKRFETLVKFDLGELKEEQSEHVRHRQHHHQPQPHMGDEMIIPLGLKMLLKMMKMRMMMALMVAVLVARDGVAPLYCGGDGDVEMMRRMHCAYYYHFP